MTCSSHLILLHYLNWWTLDTKGPSPVSWPAFELLFMLPAAWKKCWWRGGGLALRAARILLKFSSSHALTLGLWVIWTCGACHCIVSCTLCNGMLPKPNGRQVLQVETLRKCKDDKKWLQILRRFFKGFSYIQKSDSSYCLLKVKRLKWYRVLLLINSSFNHNAMPDCKFAHVMNSC